MRALTWQFAMSYVMDWSSEVPEHGRQGVCPGWGTSHNGWREEVQDRPKKKSSSRLVGSIDSLVVRDNTTCKTD